MTDTTKETRKDRTPDQAGTDTATQNKKGRPSFFKKVWDTYLKRLNKTTNGKPQCCK